MVLGEYRTDRPVSSLLKTTQDVLLSPRRFFDGLAPDGPLREPVLYYLICLAISTICNLIVFLVSFAVPMASIVATGPPEVRPLVIGLLAGLLGFVVLFPLLPVVFFFVFVLIQHGLVLLMAWRDQRGLPATLRVFCYSLGAPITVSWIPLVGLVAGFYSYYLGITGLKRVHGISTLRALIAVLIIPVLWLVLAAVGIFYAFNFVRETIDTPVSHDFPRTDVSGEPAAPTVRGGNLMDSSEDQARIRKLRDASYSDKPPPASYHVELSVATAGPSGSQRGIRG
ncbi:MAG: YIP1 family protein [Rubrobacteraceae bacterium]|nr:YIP1 family protein [Rubrobacteraceae bacterium]